jgi:putative ABC transport system permease protein
VVATRQAAIESLPGYSAEMGSVRSILGFLFVIAAMVLAAFFYVMTLQKTNQIGVLKALGASLRFLAWDLIAQVAILTIVGVIVGAALANGIASFIPVDVPFALSNRLIALYGIVLVIVSLVSSVLSLVRMARIDALIAIGKVE